MCPRTAPRSAISSTCFGFEPFESGRRHASTRGRWLVSYLPRRQCRFELERRSVDVQLRPELVDVSVSVVVERDVGRYIQRCARQLGGKSFLRVAEIVVAVDENAHIFVRQRISQAADRNVGKAETNRSLDVKLVVFLPAAGVEHDGAGLPAHAYEVAFGQAMRVAVIQGLPGDTQVTGNVDAGIGDRPRSLRVGRKHDNERTNRHNRLPAPHSDLSSWGSSLEAIARSEERR